MRNLLKNNTKYLQVPFVVAMSMVFSVRGIAKEPKRPNILFCIADDASMNSLGIYGSKFIKTPSIDKLAKKGAVFQNAFNCNPKCAPARACLLTGMYSWQLKEACNHYPHFPAEFKYYPQLLFESGYLVGYTGKGWGPGTYESKYNPAGPEYNNIKLKPPFKGISNIDYAANLEVFLEEKPEDVPFCFWLGAKEPHRTYELNSWKKNGRKLKDAEVPPFYPDNDIIRGDLLDYANEVEWFDAHIGKAVMILDQKGLLDNTLIVVTSDHGMPFPRVKGQIYEEGFHVPLVIYWKGVVKPGRNIMDFVNFPDFAPTFMEVAGLQPDDQMTGESFLYLLKSSKSGKIDTARNHVLLGKERHDIGRANEDGTDLGYPVRAIRTDNYLYAHNFKPERWPVGNPRYNFRNCDNSPTKKYIARLNPEEDDYRFFELCFGMRPKEELYDIKEDPNCMNNLASKPEYNSIVKRLKSQMLTELIQQGDPRALGYGDVFDKYEYKGNRLNYKTGKKIPSPENGKK